MGSRFPIPRMQTTSNFISVKVTNWFCFYYSDLCVLVNFFNDVHFPTYDIFSLRRVLAKEVLTRYRTQKESQFSFTFRAGFTSHAAD